jgi:CBS domain-containing protein
MVPKKKLAVDIMIREIIKVDPLTPLTDLSRLFVEEEISGAPVTDDEGRLLGVISAMDVLRVIEQEHDSPSNDPTYFRDTLEFSSPDWMPTTEDFQDRLTELTVSDAMQASVVTVTEETPIHEVAKLLGTYRIHRVLVVREEFLVGLITTFELISELEKN